MRRLTIIAATLLAGLLALPMASAASAGPAIQDQVAAALQANPGSRQVDENTIELEPGVLMSVQSDFGTNDTISGCPDLHICLYQHSNYSGSKLQFWRCQDIKLENYNLPDGRDWRDKTSSFINNQTAGRVSLLRDTKPDGTFYTYRSTALQLASNLVNYTHPGSGNWNEKIDRLVVC